ncbi:MAG: hypothetical protein IT532_00700 [Burkholderiales bacterium]|nr:hypothetical protein [Burkholderiales bacterium]
MHAASLAAAGVLMLSCAVAAAGPRGDTARLGLPEISAAASRAQVDLGRRLFMDRRLSRNGTMSCGMCHVPEQGFAQNELATSIGVEGRSLRRNAPSVLNSGFNQSYFHDGRARTLEEQAWGPLLAPDEMGNADRATVVGRVAALQDYPDAFRHAFGDAAVSEQRIGVALAAYQRSLVAGGSRFDRWYYGQEEAAMSAEEKRGFVVFRGKAQCNACHELGRTHALFTDEAFHNLGVGIPAAGPEQWLEVRLAPGVTTRIPHALVRSVSEPPRKDEGRFEVTGRPQDRAAYRTPTLRNVELTAPYMHDGSFATLREVVDFYDRGGNPNDNLDRLILPLYLSEQDKQDLVAFMRALTGANVDELARQARAAAAQPATR